MNVFLIDADNLNSGPWIDEAFRVLEEAQGVLPVRRAYGSAENLKALADTLRTWAVRPYVNLSLSKNTTDIALAADAMAFACQTPAPGLIVIGSGDADFSPLVVRLRERGIRVWCVSERSKMAREALPVYDRVILVGPELHAPGVDQPTPARTTARKAVAKKAATRKTVADQEVSTKTETVTTPSKKTVNKKSAQARTVELTVSQRALAPVTSPATAASRSPGHNATAATPHKSATSEPATGKGPEFSVVDDASSAMATVDVAAILLAVPALLTGQAQLLGAVAEPLLKARLRGKNMPPSKLFKKFPEQFALFPATRPRTVQYTPVLDAA